MKIDLKSPTEQHASWLASNPVVGCPMNCAYCFLRPDGLNQIKPQILFSARDALEDLTNSPLYTSDIPIATGTRTDYFSTPEAMSYLCEYIVGYNQRRIPNPLVIITKQKISDQMISLFKELQNSGTRFIFFLSYSGLNTTIEQGIKHDDIRDNFVRLMNAGLKVVHYWRPFVPQNSTGSVMNKVYHHVTNYAQASVITGLKVTPSMKDQFWFWKKIQELDIDLSEVEGVWPKGVKEKLDELAINDPNYPIYYASSCAIAGILRTPDYNGFYGTEVCRLNSCPKSQQEICERFYKNRIVTDQAIKEALTRLKIHGKEFMMDNATKVLTIFKPLEHSKIVNLTQTLKVKIKVKEKENDDYGWGSSVAQRKPHYV